MITKVDRTILSSELVNYNFNLVFMTLNLIFATFKLKIMTSGFSFYFSFPGSNGLP